MIVKFSYKDEMYRSSNPPLNLAALRAFLVSTFKTQLPENFNVFYTIPDQNENFPLNSEEDYENFLKIQSPKPIKVFITENQAVEQKEDVSSPKNVEERKRSDSYGFIDQQEAQAPKDSYPEEVKVNRDEVPVAQNNLRLENLIENMSESVITSKVQKYPYFARGLEEPNQEEHIRKIVKEAIREELPSIMAQLKEEILKELRPVQPVVQAPVQPYVQQVRPVEVVSKVEEKKVHVEPEEPHVERPRRIFYQGEHDEENHEVPVLKNETNPLMDQVKKLGNVLRLFPEKAKGFIEDLTVIGDPYTVTEHGKYQKSVVDKANGMKELFPEEELKMFLDLVNKYSRQVTLEQMINVYLNKDEPQEPEEVVDQEENREGNGERRQEIIDN
jgi:hypothetical protein